MPRLFVAVYPDRETAVALRAALDGLELPEHRPTRVDQIHLTALFVGEVHEKEVEAVAESVERAAAGVRPFFLAPDGWVALPEKGPARLIAAVAPAPSALAELHKRLGMRLAFHRRRRENFLPHLTLCRFARPTPFELTAPLPPIPGFQVGEVSLMRSQLDPEGAQHRTLARFDLGA